MITSFVVTPRRLTCIKKSSIHAFTHSYFFIFPFAIQLPSNMVTLLAVRTASPLLWTSRPSYGHPVVERYWTTLLMWFPVSLPCVLIWPPLQFGYFVHPLFCKLPFYSFVQVNAWRITATQYWVIPPCAKVATILDCVIPIYTSTFVHILGYLLWQDCHRKTLQQQNEQIG